MPTILGGDGLVLKRVLEWLLDQGVSNRPRLLGAASVSVLSSRVGTIRYDRVMIGEGN